MNEDRKSAVDGLIAQARAEMDATRDPDGMPPAMLKMVRDALDEEWRVENTADSELLPGQLVIKRRRQTEAKRFEEKYGAEFDRIFGAAS